MNLQIETWAELLVRWTHVFAAMAWVGSFSISWKGTSKGREGGKEDVAAHLWLVHGGGFYRIEKHKVSRSIPPRLHGFEWKAAVTWISGVIAQIRGPE